MQIQIICAPQLLWTWGACSVQPKPWYQGHQKNSIYWGNLTLFTDFSHLWDIFSHFFDVYIAIVCFAKKFWCPAEAQFLSLFGDSKSAKPQDRWAKVRGRELLSRITHYWGPSAADLIIGQSQKAREPTVQITAIKAEKPTNQAWAVFEQLGSWTHAPFDLILSYFFKWPACETSHKRAATKSDISAKDCLLSSGTYCRFKIYHRRPCLSGQK